MWARGGISRDETPPSASSAVDGPLDHLPTLFDACNSDFQNILSDNPVFLGFHAFLPDFFEIQRCFVDRRAKLYSSVVFSWKGGSFHCKILFFWYFLDFQRLV